jgi:hypothetical protein
MILPKKINRNNNNPLPVFKVNYEGEILYANKAALFLLYELGISGNKRISKKIIDEHTEIFQMHQNSVIQIATADRTFTFDVIFFNEANYIGFYAN